MHTTICNFIDMNTKFSRKSKIAGRSGSVVSPRKSPVLSRKELQRLILDMVG